MNIKTSLLAGITLIGLLCGCVTSPPTAGETVSASYVGDRARLMFDEVVVSLPFAGINTYQNLHVTLAALVNPRKASLSNSYQVEQILRRVETRVSAHTSQLLSQLGSQSLSKTEQIRERIRAEAQTVVEETFRQWDHGQDYRVEMVVVNLYWTDASVGRIPQQARGWW